jgi:hypothetical protein
MDPGISVGEVEFNGYPLPSLKDSVILWSD